MFVTHFEHRISVLVTELRFIHWNSSIKMCHHCYYYNSDNQRNDSIDKWWPYRYYGWQ